MQAYLKKHGDVYAKHIVKVSWEMTGRKVLMDFTVQKRIKENWTCDSSFSQDWSKNWGLWNHDVVEAFLQLRTQEGQLNAPYLEIQVSPLNQPFALIITEPRKTFFAPSQLDFKSSVTLDHLHWESHIELTLPDDIQGEKLFGGFFSCLGSDPREYFALMPNPEANPDFHRPELFQSLDLE
ncbi:MAG: hypothetical protein AB7I27_11390 [Bacteriovoracaceae bacterium]